jgi:hypothetical protein
MYLWLIYTDYILKQQKAKALTGWRGATTSSPPPRPATPFWTWDCVATFFCVCTLRLTGVEQTFLRVPVLDDGSSLAAFLGNRCNWFWEVITDRSPMEETWEPNEPSARSSTIAGWALEPNRSRVPLLCCDWLEPNQLTWEPNKTMPLITETSYVTSIDGQAAELRVYIRAAAKKKSPTALLSNPISNTKVTELNTTHKLIQDTDASARTRHQIQETHWTTHLVTEKHTLRSPRAEITD